jgi:multimeric flavodoxin WrbA
MKVLLANGSPHEKGSTYAALSEVAKALNAEGIDAEIFWIGLKSAGGCISCWKCGQLHKCAFDDAVNEFREKSYEADGFIFGTPVHYAAASGSMTGFMDRLFYSELVGNGNRAFRMKPAAAVLTARRAGTTAAFDQMNKYFTIQEMPVVSASYWNTAYGGMPGAASQDEEGLAVMRELGRNMAYLLRCQEAGRNAGIEPPPREQKPMTNFIR